MYNFSIKPLDNLSFAEKLNLLSDLRVMNIELYDNIDGVKFSDMTGAQVQSARDALIDAGIRLICADVAFGEDMKLASRNLMALGCKYIKVCVPKTASADEIRVYIDAQAKIANAFGIGIAIENNADTALSYDENITNIIKPTDALMIFNPYEFVRLQRHPFFHMFYGSKLKNRVVALRANDGIYSTQERKPLAHGNSEVKETASILLARSFDGYFSFVQYEDEDISKWISDFKGLLKAM